MQRLTEKDMCEAAYAFNVWAVTADKATTEDDLINPLFWAHVSRFLKVGDRIEVRSTDLDWYAELMVMGGNTTQTFVRLMRWVHLNSADIKKPTINADDYEIGWAGPSQKFRVLRKADKAVIQTGFDDKKTAQDFISTMAA
jgi:hypothetical protein